MDWQQFSDVLKILLELLANALIPVALSVIIYLISKKTAFSKLPYMVSQIIIGLLFGGVSILCNELGVNIGTAIISVRDAGPLCAGLLFGGPAGLIAGFIGGLGRFLSTLIFAKGAYSVVACSISTALAGVFAFVLRKLIFDNKRPSWGLSFVTGVVMEVIHLTMLMITKIDDSETAYSIIKTATIPMVLCNSLSVMLASVILHFLCDEWKNKKIKIKSISQQIQTALLICVLVAYLATTLFVFLLQTNTAIQTKTKELQMSISDVENDVTKSTNNDMLAVARLVLKDYEKNNDIDLNELVDKYDISEIDIIDGNGIIEKCSEESYVGYDMKSQEQSMEFMVLLDNSGTTEFCQGFRRKGINDDTSMKYVGISLSERKSGFIQVGLDRPMFNLLTSQTVKGITENRHVGNNGYILVVDEEGNILSGKPGVSDTKLVFETSNLPDMNKMFKATLYGEDVYCVYHYSNSFIYLAVMPRTEVFAERDKGAFINSYMEVIVFAAFFILVYIMIKKLVVDKLRNINGSLNKIINGNLNEMVTVQSSEEFVLLSSDINTTVDTLKRYIEAAEKKIESELAFAKSIQHAALPSAEMMFPDEPYFNINATMDTAKEVGGDFYDFYRLGETKIAFTIADVSGKGIPAAMFMMTAKTMLKNLAESGKSVDEVFTQANNKLCDGNEAGMFVTAWMGILDLETGNVFFANAGHNPPLIYRKDGTFEYLPCKAGLVLAGMEGMRYKPQSFKLNKGDRLFLYTDGVTEATNGQKQLYGEDRLKEFLNNNIDVSTKELPAKLKADIDLFVGDAEQFDDITMLVLEYTDRDNDMTEKTFDADEKVFPEVLEFLESELEKAECGMKAQVQINTAVEELFVNVARYAYPNKKGKVYVGFKMVDRRAFIRFSDNGIPFNPLEKENPDITLSAENRNIGGLGIYLVKKTMDKVDYEYVNGQNILTIEKEI